jgi:hypothetical protein
MGDRILVTSSQSDHCSLRTAHVFLRLEPAIDAIANLLDFSRNCQRICYPCSRSRVLPMFPVVPFRELYFSRRRFAPVSFKRWADEIEHAYQDW